MMDGAVDIGELEIEEDEGEALLADETQALAAGRGGDDRVSLALEEVASGGERPRGQRPRPGSRLLAHPSSLSPPGSQHTRSESTNTSHRDLPRRRKSPGRAGARPDVRSVLADGSRRPITANAGE